MAQFDVYINPSRATRKAYPFLLDVQIPMISEITTRIVLPLGELQNFKNEYMKILTPVIEYKGEKLILVTPQISAVPSKILQEPVGSLKDFRDEIIAALDFAITGI